MKWDMGMMMMVWVGNKTPGGYYLPGSDFRMICKIKQNEDGFDSGEIIR